MEVKVTKGHGTTIDVVLVNGVLHEGDQIVFCSLQASSKLSFSLRFVDLLVSELLIIYFASQGPIVTTIRALLTPHPMQDLRVKVRFRFFYLLLFSLHSSFLYIICVIRD